MPEWMLFFVRYISGEMCEKGSGFLPVLKMNVVCDYDTAGTVRGYLMHHKQPGKGVVICRYIVRKEMRRDLPDGA